MYRLRAQFADGTILDALLPADTTAFRCAQLFVRIGRGPFAIILYRRMK